MRLQVSPCRLCCMYDITSLSMSLTWVELPLHALLARAFTFGLVVVHRPRRSVALWTTGYGVVDLQVAAEHVYVRSRVEETA